MRVYHLSHTDLDGYGCQVVTKHYFKNVEFFNSNYGREIEAKFDEIISLIDSRDEKSLVLVTDLNLTLGQCEKFETALNERDSKILLLDHHQTGLECAKNFGWYLLDNSRCATKITYDFFSKAYGSDEKLSKFVDVVNAVDIWIKEDANFEMGKVCMGIVSGAKEINKIMFDETSREYIFHLLKEAESYFYEDGGHIKLDDTLHQLKKGYFLDGNDDTLSNLVSNFVVKKLSDEREKFEINYLDKKGVLTYNIGNTSVIGNDFLVANPDIDFFIDATSRKTMSFRANGKVDVSQMAKHLIGGGGHVNASGGLFMGFKDDYSYEPIKAQIVELIEKKTAELENEKAENNLDKNKGDENAK
ncbi:MAG: 3'-to-5' oligoribonuclease B [Campylobacteraceae bacterium]|nr:3'-to-5' oligoribonuclease B [Campylobacteraceae bacterium]